MIPRVLEPEVMDTETEAVEYDRMDHTTVNQKFVTDFLAVWSVRTGDVLDVGTGTAQIPIELCQRATGFDVEAVDAAAEMLKIAKANIASASLTARIRTALMDAKHLPYPDGRFDAVISNSIVHHIPDPSVVFDEALRVCAAGGVIFIRDLLRPESDAELTRLVELHAAGATNEQRRLFTESLHAALTVTEVVELVSRHGFVPGTVAQTSDRHWTWSAIKPQ